MSSVIILSLFFFFQSPYVFAQTQDIFGKVLIGQDINDTTSLYTFNENYNSQFNIPILLVLMNVTTGEIVPDQPQTIVVVTCETSPVQTGYTQADFVPQTIFPPTVKRPVQFSNPTPGRSANLRCWGETRSADSEFTKDVSLSDPVSFEVRKAGSVSFYKSVVTIANEADNIDIEGTFLVELSEVVEVFNVTVTCIQDATGVVGAMNLQLNPQLVQTGSRKSLISYKLLSRGNPVVVSCTAQSRVTPLNQGQFQTATSRGLGATFTLVEGSVDLIPEKAEIETTQLNAYLVLDTTPTADVVFACYLRVADNSTHAKTLAANPICVMPDFTGPTRPSSNDSLSESFETTPPGGLSAFPLLYDSSDDVDIMLADNTTDNMVTGVTSSHGNTGADKTTTAPIETVTSGTPTPAPTTTPAPSVPTNITGEWTLASQIYIFESNSDSFRRVVIRRTLNVNAPKTELFVVTCCAPPDSNDSPKYENKSSALIVASYLTPYHPINWANTTTSENRETETVIINPAYIEVSVCPCDLTEGSCDINCCCDELCTATDIATFSCIPGIYGGNATTPPRYMCDADPYPNKPDWFTIMCVQWNSSGFLGYYKYPEAALREQSDYDDKAASYRPQYRYQEEADRFPPESSGTSTGYRESGSIRTGLPINAPFTDFYIGNNYKLTLPRPTLEGACVWSAPLQFLRQTEDACTWQMSEALCESFTPLSALIYAQSDTWSGAKGPLVLAKAGVSDITNTNVNYLCADSSDGYVRTTTRYDELVKAGQSYLFDYEVPDEGDCEFDSNSGAYVCTNQTTGGSTESALPPRCPWDDGSTKPPAPVLASGICSNAVLDVLYNITWQGDSILYLNATIILSSVSLTVNLTDVDTAPSHLTQRYNVLYNHRLGDVLEENSTDAGNSSVTSSGTLQYKRSGNPGYELGLPVISGTAIYETNDTTGENTFLYVDSNATNRIALWLPEADGLCQSAQRQELEFGVSMMGSCQLRLSLSDLQDCYNLRRLVLNRQDSLMLSSQISQVGDPNYTNLALDWAKVFRQDISWILDNTTDSNTTAVPGTTVTTAPVTTTLTATTAGSSNASTPSFLDTLTGQCVNIPSGIHLDVMYAEVGQRDAVPIHQIVGAKISYTLSKWRLKCAGPAGTACYSNATWVQDMTTTEESVQAFMLSSTVNYIKVPAQDPVPKSKYEEDNTPRVWKCAQDACWEEIFYPFMAINPGDDPQYTLSMGLIFLVFLCGAFLVVRPVSRWDYIHVQL